MLKACVIFSITSFLTLGIDLVIFYHPTFASGIQSPVNKPKLNNQPFLSNIQATKSGSELTNAYKRYRNGYNEWYDDFQLLRARSPLLNVYQSNAEPQIRTENLDNQLLLDNSQNKQRHLQPINRYRRNLRPPQLPVALQSNLPIQTAAYYYPNSLNQQILIPTSYIQPWQWNNWNNRPGSEPIDIYQPNQNIGVNNLDSNHVPLYYKRARIFLPIGNKYANNRVLNRYNHVINNAAGINKYANNRVPNHYNPVINSAAGANKYANNRVPNHYSHSINNAAGAKKYANNRVPNHDNQGINSVGDVNKLDVNSVPDVNNLDKNCLPCLNSQRPVLHEKPILDNQQWPDETQSNGHASQLTKSHKTYPYRVGLVRNTVRQPSSTPSLLNASYVMQVNNAILNDTNDANDADLRYGSPNKQPASQTLNGYAQYTDRYIKPREMLRWRPAIQRPINETPINLQAPIDTREPSVQQWPGDRRENSDQRRLEEDEVYRNIAINRAIVNSLIMPLAFLLSLTCMIDIVEA
ncbi:unnamed protein product, partial [Rotaria magnacalcarata]